MKKQDEWLALIMVGIVNTQRDRAMTAVHGRVDNLRKAKSGPEKQPGEKTVIADGIMAFNFLQTHLMHSFSLLE